jgi:hypothetical protein
MTPPGQGGAALTDDGLRRLYPGGQGLSKRAPGGDRSEIGKTGVKWGKANGGALDDAIAAHSTAC